MRDDPHTSVRIPLKRCVGRVPNPRACTPPGFEWIPGYLGQYGGQMTDYGRNWLLDKWEEPYRAALETAEREYQDCLLGGAEQPPAGDKPSGLHLHVAAALEARSSSNGTAATVGMAAQVNVRFSPSSSTRPRCDPFDPNFDPEHPSYPADPDAPVVTVPHSVFWQSASATYDLDALEQAMQPVNGTLNQANPLSLRDLRLSADGVKGAVRITGHGYLPIPARVRVNDDLRTDLEVVSIRLDFSAEWANNGAVLNEWPAVSTSAAYMDFNCYYFGCSWWASPPPVFDWALVPPGCIEDLVFRALPTAITQVRVSAGSGESLGTLTLSNSNAGTIDSRPVVAQHRIFNSPGTPQSVLPVVNAGPATPGVTQDIVVALPSCIAGKVDLAPDNIQDFSLFQQDGVIDVSAAPGTAPGTIKLRLTLLRPVYHWDRDVDIRLIPQGGVDVGYPPQGWWPHVILRVPVSWNGCDAFQPVRDCRARVVVQGWTALALRHWYPDGPLLSPAQWLHSLTLRVVDHAAPCEAFDCVWGSMRVTWPDGTRQTQQIMCIPGDIDAPREFTLQMAVGLAPTVSVELELHYEASNRRRRADGNGFDYLAVPGPAVIHQTLTP